MSMPKVLVPGESMPTVYPNKAKMLNGNGNGGDGSGHILPTVVQPDKVEESGTLMHQQALDTVLVVPTWPIQLFDGSCNFAHALSIIVIWRVLGMCRQ